MGRWLDHVHRGERERAHFVIEGVGATMLMYPLGRPGPDRHSSNTKSSSLRVESTCSPAEPRRAYEQVSAMF